MTQMKMVIEVEGGHPRQHEGDDRRRPDQAAVRHQISDGYSDNASRRAGPAIVEGVGQLACRVACGARQ